MIKWQKINFPLSSISPIYLIGLLLRGIGRRWAWRIRSRGKAAGDWIAFQCDAGCCCCCCCCCCCYCCWLSSFWKLERCWRRKSRPGDDESLLRRFAFAAVRHHIRHPSRWPCDESPSTAFYFSRIIARRRRCHTSTLVGKFVLHLQKIKYIEKRRYSRINKSHALTAGSYTL